VESAFFQSEKLGYPLEEIKTLYHDYFDQIECQQNCQQRGSREQAGAKTSTGEYGD